jgi:hypothetical protein
LSEPATRRPLWREPALWGFLIGAAMMTAVVPLIRRVPAPPSVVGRVPANWAWSLEDVSGTMFGARDLTGHVAIVALLSRDVDAAVVLGRAFETLDQRYERADADILLVAVDLAGRSAAERAAWITANAPTRRARWHVLGGTPEATCAVAREIFTRPAGPVDCRDLPAFATPPSLVLLDPAGGLRGVYGSGGDALDEGFERSLRVLDEAHAR